MLSNEGFPLDGSDGSQHVVDRLAEEIIERYRRGERPTLDEYVLDYPAHADELREVFPALILLETIKPRSEDSGSGARPRRGDDRPPARLRDFRVLREIGRGGMGVVYEAEQESLGRRVALKVLRQSLVSTAHDRARFQHEARAAARLHHTNIVPVFGVGQQDDLNYYVMQLIPGFGVDMVLEELRRLRFSTLDSSGRDEVAGVAEQDPAHASARDVARSLIHGRSNKPNWQAIARLGVQAAEGLQYAHEQGVLHRDVKPSNLMLDGRGAVWLTDFGLAKTEEEQDLTQVGDLIGTLRYMAPERFFQSCDARSDVYGLGLTLYELATLRPAFDESQRARLLRHILQHDPRRPREVAPEIPRDLETIILKAIARAPERRYAAAADLADDLRRFLDGKAVRARRATSVEIAWRWCGRNRLAASLLLALAAAIVVGFAGISWKWREAEFAREDERAARQDADEHAQQRRQAFDDLLAAQRLVERGRAANDDRRWDDAVLAFSRAIERRPEHQGAWDARGFLYARLGLWERVREDWTHAFKLRPPEATWKWLQLGLVHLEAGDRASYRRLCAQMRARFLGSTEPLVAMELVRTCMALPDPGADPRQMAELAQTVASLQPEVAWYQYVAGLAEYRAGHDERAIEAFRRSLESDLWPAREINLPMLSLVYHRLGRTAEAEQALAEADVARERWVESMFRGVDPIGWPTHQDAEPRWPVSWSDWFEFVANYREAHQILRGSPPADDPRWSVLRARALTGLRRRREAAECYAAALTARPDDPRIRMEAHRNRGYLHAEAGQWHEAAEEFAAASKLRPDDPRLFTFQMSARLAADDDEAYRVGCREMFRRFHESSDPRLTHELVATCVLGADSLPDMTQLIPLGRMAASRGLGNTRLWGAACYRAGHYDDAGSCFDEAARLVRPTAWLWCFRAMTHEHQKHYEEARRCLAEAEAWVDAARRRTGDDVTEDGPCWDGMANMIETTILLREARSLINGQPGQG